MRSTHRHRPPLVVAAAATLVLLAPFAGGQEPVPLGGEFQVGTDGYAFTAPSVAALPAGGFVVVWTAFTLTDTTYTWARGFPPGGLPGEPPLELFSGGVFHGNFLDVPQPEPAAGGGFVVVYEVVNTYYFPDRVATREVDPSGAVVGSHVLGAYDYQGGYFQHGDPSSDRGENGELIVVWNAASPGSAILGRRVAPSGAPLDEPFVVNDGSGGPEVFPDVAKAPDDGFLVVWQSADDDGSGISGRRFDAAATPETGDVAINALAAGNQGDPVIAALGDDGFVVVWEDDGRDGSALGLFGRRVDVDGTPLGDDFPINQVTAGGQHEPAVAAAASGFVVAWTDAAGLDGDTAGVFVRQFGADGTPLGDQVLVNETTAGWQDLASVAATAPAEITVVWRSVGEGIFGRRFAVALFEDGFETGDVSRWSAAAP